MDTTVSGAATAAAPTLNADDTARALAPVIADLQADIALGVKIVQAAKAGGRSAALALLPDVITEVKKNIADVQNALPVIKPGIKTTEFWIVVGSLVGLGIFAYLTHHQLTSIDFGIVGSIATAYASLRTWHKS